MKFSTLIIIICFSFCSFQAFGAIGSKQGPPSIATTGSKQGPPMIEIKMPTLNSTGGKVKPPSASRLRKTPLIDQLINLLTHN